MWSYLHSESSQLITWFQILDGICILFSYTIQHHYLNKSLIKIVPIISCQYFSLQKVLLSQLLRQVRLDRHVQDEGIEIVLPKKSFIEETCPLEKTLLSCWLYGESKLFYDNSYSFKLFKHTTFFHFKVPFCGSSVKLGGKKKMNYIIHLYK